MCYSTSLPIVVDVFCRQPIRCPSPVGEFLVGSRRSSDNHGLELGIYINMIVRWFIHASVVSYVQNNNASGSIKTLEHVASLWDKIWLVSVAGAWHTIAVYNKIMKHVNPSQFAASDVVSKLKVDKNVCKTLTTRAKKTHKAKLVNVYPVVLGGSWNVL